MLEGWGRMRKFVSLISMLLAFVAMAGKGHAAISYQRLETAPGERALTINCVFESSDDAMTLVDEYTQYQPSYVTFDSPGGNVVAAIRFGRALRLLNAKTIQIRAAECASACAFAFVGGVERFAQPGSIGVHRVSLSDDVAIDSQLAISTVQALTGEIIGYLTDMGVSPNLLQLSLSIDSSDIRYLTAAEMRDWNINTPEDMPSPEEGAAPPSDAAPEVSATPAVMPPDSSDSEEVAAAEPGDLTTEAVDFVNRYNDEWSKDSASALAFMKDVYADEVSFFGNPVDKGVVLKDKATFAQRWPQRIYSVKPGSVTASCAGKCEMSGVVEWFAGNRDTGKTSSGMAEFSFVWNTASLQIESESGKVLTTDKGAKAPDRLIHQWTGLDDLCRTSVDRQGTEVLRACKRRDELGPLLNRVDWCYGHEGEAEINWEWQKCDANSRRYTSR
ncbi:putative periplasmic protein [Rhizobium leguminosarum bv. trifolii WSM597]|uniref:Putative periplasmic protein n=1 Tax=Rhizobium leguminosarum bv. trifolii WSM597 TaxID=754764 RepID=I9X2Y3_RHILT|nr:putative periplasmic protein [Rhizobium leguminosarum bv. trifolii WSM597]